MITHFLTSSPCIGYDGDLNPANNLIEELRMQLPRPLKCLLISSAPDDREMTDRMAWGIREAFDHVDMSFSHYEVLDRRTYRSAARMVRDANFIVLCGGHVPTENKFFEEIGLRAKLKKWDGVILSISAGSMNSADIVYASPELDGESIDPKYKVLLKGLGLTDINILPHFEMLKDYVLDGKRLMEEIVYDHSYKLPVYCLNDGSYFLIRNGRTELRGEAYKLDCGKMKQICKDDERKLMTKNGALRKL
mgnify:CR=1 FL=1